MRDRINHDAWELWEFDGLASDGATAVTVSFYRDTRCLEQGGFHAELNAVWPDGRRWGEKLYFPRSSITAGGETETISGVWASDSAKAEFEIATDLSIARVRFQVPGKVQGTFDLFAEGRGVWPEGEDAALLAPGVFYIFPMGPARASASLVFYMEEGLIRNLELGGDANGGFVRGWSAVAWPEILTDAYYVGGRAGPYSLQIIRILSSAATGREPHVAARLYRDTKLVFSVNDGTNAVVTKILDQDDEEGKWLKGAFRDRNIGYSVQFSSCDGLQQWRFELRHKTPWWSDYTSDQGTGKSGFLEVLFGGAVGEETFQGFGGAGQLELP